MGNVVVLGAGPAGISAAYHLKQRGIDAKIYEKKEDYGGLCGGFSLGEFHFDIFAHMTFSKDPVVNELLEQRTPFLTHVPEAYNYYKGQWVRNPVQTNLKELDVETRIRVIQGFVDRDCSIEPKNYEQWLQKQYGQFFAEEFPKRYTRKYWTVEASQLETEWVRNRMYVPSLEEMLRGAMETKTPNVHYSKEMHYPVKGGFRGFLEPLAERLTMEFQSEVSGVDSKEKCVYLKDGRVIPYDYLITSLPLSEVGVMYRQVPQKVKEAAMELDYTSAFAISLGLKKKVDFPCVWFYIYDEEILPARVYWTDRKSPTNAPEGCSGLQAEVYVSKYNRDKMEKYQRNRALLLQLVIEQLVSLQLFEKEDIVISEIRYEKFANIMFTPAIYEAREVVKDYLKEQGIYSIGRFGEWDYLWLEQSLLSGKKAAEDIANEYHL